MLRRSLTALAVSTLVLANACTLPQGPQDSENTAPPVNALTDPAHPGIEALSLIHISEPTRPY